MFNGSKKERVVNYEWKPGGSGGEEWGNEIDHPRKMCV